MVINWQGTLAMTGRAHCQCQVAFFNFFESALSVFTVNTAKIDRRTISVGPIVPEICEELGGYNGN